jgi:hypothetical protein
MKTLIVLTSHAELGDSSEKTGCGTSNSPHPTTCSPMPANS